MYKTKAYAADSATSPLARTSIPRRDPTDRDVRIEILFCGICHSDLHYARDEWHDVMPTVYPCVPGHEIVGRVTKVGAAVKKYKAGDLVGVGCLVDSDHTCPNCREGLEQALNRLHAASGAAGRHSRTANLAQFELRNLHVVATLIAECALLREESRGGHYRSDFPVSRPEFQHPSSISRTASATRA